VSINHILVVGMGTMGLVAEADLIDPDGMLYIIEVLQRAPGKDQQRVFSISTKMPDGFRKAVGSAG